MPLDKEKTIILRRRIDEFVDEVDTAWFTHQDIWKECGVITEDGKAVVRERIRELIEKQAVERSGMRFRRKQKGRRMDGRVDPGQTIPIAWPTGTDGSTFGLDEIELYRKAIIVVAGVSNMGKTAWCLNMVANNLEKWEGKIKYITNELADEELVARMMRICWVPCFTEDGDFRFTAVELGDSWQDEIEPNWLNFVDYLDPGENPYMIGRYIDNIRNKLDGGAAVIAIQKGGHKYTGRDGKQHFATTSYGTGGQYSEHRARVVIHLDPTDHGSLQLMTIKKAKSGLTGKQFTYALYNNGIEFREIQEVVQ